MCSEGFFVEPPDPREKLPWLQLIRVPRQGKLRFVVLSTDVNGVRIHRIDKKPHRCIGDGCTVDGCPNCGQWEGYIEIMSLVDGKKAMLAITPDVSNRILEISVEASLRIRGLELEMERSCNRQNAIILVGWNGKIHADRDIPPGRNMRPFIDRLFRRRS